MVSPSFGKPIEKNIYFGKLELFAFPQIEGTESKKNKFRLFSNSSQPYPISFVRFDMLRMLVFLIDMLDQ